MASQSSEQGTAMFAVNNVGNKLDAGRLSSVEIGHITVIATGKFLKTAILQDEDLIEGEVITNPASFVHQLRNSAVQADILTFAQKLPDTSPKYSYDCEWDNLAIIPITTYSDWWDKRVESSVRRAVRKAAKDGVTVRVVDFNDEFVNGIVKINNETPIRQGRPFWHFNKSFDLVKSENSTYAERNTFIGAYYKDELIGFIRITHTDNVAHILQSLSMMKHYDKRPANALIAKAVEFCVEKKVSYLTYRNFIYNDPDSSLTEFKRRNGFEKVLVPRYYIPLNAKGKIALSLGLHRNFISRLPKPLISRLLRIRNSWYSRRAQAVEGTA